jgi:membrane-associated protease RseP (regulator of RpoE activity)
MYLLSRTDVETGLPPFLLPEVVRQVWGDPALLRLGLSFSIPALVILLAHELGHYIACRRYRLPATLPYFLPVPINFGTFGAFIKIKAPIRSRRELFDVGIAGPIAGFVALLPFLLYGVAHSVPAPLRLVPEETGPGLWLLGRCLAIQLAALPFHGWLGSDTVLNLHPFALAAWLGLLATSINLLPLGQLDGGHILYAATGRLQRLLAVPLWMGLGLVGLVWEGWLLWCLIILVIGLRHPPVADESAPIGPWRRRLAWAALAMLLLSFFPQPLELVFIQ